MKEVKKFEWQATYFDVNGQTFRKYNVIKNLEDEVKKLKKKYSTKEEFEKEFKIRVMSRYWSKCEWEIIIKKKESRIILTPWCGGRDGISLDVTDDDSFDWDEFINWEGHHERNTQVLQGEELKIDVYDQLKFRWDEFIKYVWNFHHKYQKIKKV